MEPTMEHENKPVNTFVKKLPDPPSVPINIPVGPEDFLKKYTKESFGKTKTNFIAIIIGILVAILLFAIYNKWI